MSVGSDPSSPALVKPRLRGVFHLWAAPLALVGGLVLIALAPNAKAAFAGGLYAFSLLTLFAVSATYHLVTWSPEKRAWMRRADHASIFVLIAGTYTPVSLLALPFESGKALFIFVWSGAALGVLQSLFWIRAPKWIAAALAVIVGWSIVPWLGEARQAMLTSELVLIFGGGVAYTLGAVAYALKRPNPKPEVFGYHEVFHALTLVAAALHFAAILSLVTRTPA